MAHHYAFESARSAMIQPDNFVSKAKVFAAIGSAATAAGNVAWNAAKRAWVESKWQARILPQAIVRDAFRTATREAVAKPIRAQFRSNNYMPYKRSYARRSYRKPRRIYKKRYGALRYRKRKAFGSTRSRFGTAGSRQSSSRLLAAKPRRAFRNLRFVDFTT